jgi:hypothetical protein
MEINTISETVLEDGATEMIVQTNAKELQLLGYILEGFEGYCNYTTIEKERILLKIVIPEKFKQEIKKIIAFLRDPVSCESN